MKRNLPHIFFRNGQWYLKYPEVPLDLRHDAANFHKWKLAHSFAYKLNVKRGEYPFFDYIHSRYVLVDR